MKTKTIWTTASLLALAAGTAPAAAQSENGTPSDADVVDNIIVVTAQKRSETLLEVPQSISVVSGAMLERQQATSFTDYASLIPGLSLEQANPGETRIVLRGINTGGASPTAAIYIDETPFGASTGQSNGAILAADIDPFDIERVEVLKGPQGTLYGASSLGGLVKFVTVAPLLAEFEARVQGGLETVEGGDMGWSANGVVNVPIGDTLAVRASGFYRRVGGFIDTLGIAREDVNDVVSYGGRASLLFKPSEALSVRLTALAQNIRADSRAAFDADPVTLEPLELDPTTGDPTDGRLARTQYFPDQNDVDYRLYNATVDLDVGFGTLTSATSYGELEQKEFTDSSYELAGIGDAFYGDVGTPGPRGITLPGFITQEKFTQELRLSSNDSETFEWLVGGYFTKENGGIFQRYLPFALDTGELIDPAITLPVGPNGEDVAFDQLIVARLDSEYKEYAAFGSVTLHLTPRLEITAGGRYSYNDQSSTQLLAGALTGSPDPDITNGASDEDVITWSVAPRYELSDYASVYARVAKGYRPGGPNVVPPGAGPNFPSQFEADTLISYEAGIRAETADRTFDIDASLFYLDWRNVQVLVIYQTDLGPIGGDGNGDGATSKGMELSATMRPMDGLSFRATTAYTDATLSDDLPTGDASAGDRLPYAPEWTFNLGANYEWDLSNEASAFVGGNLSLISDQAAVFDTSYEAAFGRRLVIDGYETIDLRAGIDFGRYRATAYVKNLTDNLGLNYVGSFGARPGTAVSAAPIRPRTFGITVGADF